MTNLIVVFDWLVGESLFVQLRMDGVCAMYEAVWVRRRIDNVVGRIHVVGELAPTFDGEGVRMRLFSTTHCS
jgi:hypothetical protein